jgi:hypothetical protein
VGEQTRQKAEGTGLHARFLLGGVGDGSQEFADTSWGGRILIFRKSMHRRSQCRSRREGEKRKSEMHIERMEERWILLSEKKRNERKRRRRCFYQRSSEWIGG